MKGINGETEKNLWLSLGLKPGVKVRSYVLSPDLFSSLLALEMIAHLFTGETALGS